MNEARTEDGQVRTALLHQLELFVLNGLADVIIANLQIDRLGWSLVRSGSGASPWMKCRGGGHSLPRIHLLSLIVASTLLLRQPRYAASSYAVKA